MNLNKFIESNAVFDWFPYLQDFSGKFVCDVFKRFGITKGDKVLDPYVGSGTTLLASKLLGIDSVGIDYNPFCTFISRIKTNWEIDSQTLEEQGGKLIERISPRLPSYGKGKNLIPSELGSIKPPAMPNLDRWMAEKVVQKVLAVKEQILETIDDKAVQEFFLLALASILREVSNVTLSLNVTINSQKDDAPVYDRFAERALRMVRDYKQMLMAAEDHGSVKVIQGDSRHIDRHIDLDERFDFVITSPPYPNDIDYVNQSRMEVFFLDLIKDEDEFRELKRGMITSDAIYYVWAKNKSELIRQKCNNCGAPLLPLSSGGYRCTSTGKFAKPSSKGEYAVPEVMKVVEELEKAYEDKDWGWDYPKMTAEYFGDIFLSLKSLHKVMNDDRKCVYVVGDAAFRGIHVPADGLVKLLAEKAGFSNGKVEPIRDRSASSHGIPLRESLVIFET